MQKARKDRKVTAAGTAEISRIHHDAMAQSNALGEVALVGGGRKPAAHDFKGEDNTGVNESRSVPRSDKCTGYF
jgi:hypothetical protein